MKKIARIRQTHSIAHLADNGDPPEPWRSSLRSIEKNFLFSLPSSATEAASRIVETEWVFYTHYVYREKWNPKHKIPRISKHTKLFGNYLLTLLELCIQIHVVHPLGENYKNAAKWFDRICWDFKYTLRREIYVPGGVKKILGEYRRATYDYRAFMNPHSESELHLQRLVNAVIDIKESGKFPKLIDINWKECISALTTYTTFLDRQGGSVPVFFVEQDNLWIQNGKGKARILVPSEVLESII